MMVLDNPDPIKAEADFGGPVKQCIACLEWLPADTDFFYKRAAARDGLNEYCKCCWYEMEQKRIQRLREQGKGPQERSPKAGARSHPARIITINQQDREKALGYLSEGKSWRRTAGLMGIDDATLYRWIKADPTFRQQVQEAQAQARASAAPKKRSRVG